MRTEHRISSETPPGKHLAGSSIPARRVADDIVFPNGMSVTGLGEGTPNGICADGEVAHVASRLGTTPTAVALAWAAAQHAYRAIGSPGWSTRTSAPGASSRAAETNWRGSRLLLVISLSPIRPLVKA